MENTFTPKRKRIQDSPTGISPELKKITMSESGNTGKEKMERPTISELPKVNMPNEWCETRFKKVDNVENRQEELIKYQEFQSEQIAQLEQDNVELYRKLREMSLDITAGADPGGGP